MSSKAATMRNNKLFILVQSPFLSKGHIVDLLPCSRVTYLFIPKERSEIDQVSYDGGIPMLNPQTEAISMRKLCPLALRSSNPSRAKLVSVAPDLSSVAVSM